jgi:hypothetical protein
VTLNRRVSERLVGQLSADPGGQALLAMALDAMDFPVDGRKLDIEATFVVTSSPFKNGKK